VPRSGISFSPEFEAREAARWSLLTWRQFCALDGEEQSATVAQYRVSHMIEAVLAMDQDKRARQKRSKG
jgi:hypothetical protein